MNYVYCYFIFFTVECLQLYEINCVGIMDEICVGDNCEQSLPCEANIAAALLFKGTVRYPLQESKNQEAVLYKHLWLRQSCLYQTTPRLLLYSEIYQNTNNVCYKKNLSII